MGPDFPSFLKLKKGFTFSVVFLLNTQFFDFTTITVHAIHVYIKYTW